MKTVKSRPPPPRPAGHIQPKGGHEVEAIITTRADIVTDFLAEIDTTAKTRETYTRALKQWGEWVKSNGIETPTPSDVIRYKNHLKESKKAATVNTYLTAVRAFYRWAEATGNGTDIAKNIKGAKTSNVAGHDALTASQLARVISLARGAVEQNPADITAKRNYALTMLLASNGLRTIEAARADVGDIRHRGTSIFLAVQGKGREEKDGTAVLAPETYNALAEYLTARRAVGESLDNAPLFISHGNNGNGNRLTTRSISRIVKSLLITAGYNDPRLTAHSLRHTAVTLLLEAGENLQAVQCYARHSDINTTLRYAHNLQAEQYNGSEIIEKLATA